MMERVIALLCVVVLLPILPAFLFYKYLPAEAVASGPFRGLQIKLTGAFAAYFLTLLVVIGSAQVWINAEIVELQEEVEALRDNRVELWTIKGWIREEAQARAPEEADQAMVSIRPPKLYVQPDGFFVIEDIPLSRRHLREGLVLEINHKNYERTTAHLAEAEDSLVFGNQYLLMLDDASKLARVDRYIELAPDDTSLPYMAEGAVHPEAADPAAPVH